MGAVGLESLAWALSADRHTICAALTPAHSRPGIGVAAWRFAIDPAASHLLAPPRFLQGDFLFVTLLVAASKMLTWRHCELDGEVMSGGSRCRGRTLPCPSSRIGKTLRVPSLVGTPANTKPPGTIEMKLGNED